MNIEALHIGLKVKHPQYGPGTVKGLTEHTADIRFDDGVARTVSPSGSGLVPAEPQATITGLTQSLEQLINTTVGATVDQLGIERPNREPEALGTRWLKGRMVLHPADPALQPKEVPIEVFFHKIVMMRNNLRVLEQRINAHEKLEDGEKVEMQTYISRCYGSMTTFNVLFRAKADHFSGS